MPSAVLKVLAYLSISFVRARCTPNTASGKASCARNQTQVTLCSKLHNALLQSVMNCGNLGMGREGGIRENYARLCEMDIQIGPPGI